PETSPYDDRVYARGRENFQRLFREHALQPDAQPRFYAYRQVMGSHSQLGLVGVASCQEYLQNVIRKHELTRPENDDDRFRHIDSLNAQPGPAFLPYPADPILDECLRRGTAGEPAVDFVASDSVRHSSWILADSELTQAIQTQFAQ